MMKFVPKPLDACSGWQGEVTRLLKRSCHISP